MENYIINKNTLLILPYNYGSKIIEKYGSYESTLTPKEIVDESCKYYGSSLTGRIEATSYMLGIKYKCPIIISEVSQIIMFPTKSFLSLECIYINSNAINSYKSDNKSVKITLINNNEITVNTSKQIINNQILKSSRLELVLKNKKY